MYTAKWELVLLDILYKRSYHWLWWINPLSHFITEDITSLPLTIIKKTWKLWKLFEPQHFTNTPAWSPHCMMTPVQPSCKNLTLMAYSNDYVWVDGIFKLLCTSQWHIHTIMYESMAYSHYYVRVNGIFTLLCMSQWHIQTIMYESAEALSS